VGAERGKGSAIEVSPFKPYTLHLTPFKPYTLHPAPCTLHPTPYTLHPSNPTPCTLHPTPPASGKEQDYQRAGEEAHTTG